MNTFYYICTLRYRFALLNRASVNSASAMVLRLLTLTASLALGTWEYCLGILPGSSARKSEPRVKINVD